jgi:hypothetical protein
MTSETVILSSPAKWKQWLSIVRAQCDAAEIWEYVDPSKSINDDSTKLHEPAELATPAAAASEATWTPYAKIEWTKLVRKDDELRAIWKRKQEAIRSLRIHIYKTIAEVYLPFTVDNKDKSVHKLLINLKNQIAPTDEVRRYELQALWAQQRTYPEASNIERWLQDWATYYKECVLLNLAEVTGERAQHDFLLAIRENSPEFSGYWRNELARRRRATPVQQPPGFLELVDDYRTQRRETLAASGEATSQSAFATTLQGVEISNSLQSSSRSLPCLCTKQHLYKECPYICENQRPANWEPDPAVTALVQQNLAMQKPHVQELVRNMQKNSGPTGGAVSHF